MSSHQTSSERTGAEWLAALGNPGPERQRAVDDLHSHLVRAAGFYLGRHRSDLRDMARDELVEFIEECAQEALNSIEEDLGAFQGISRFTTWAYAVAIRVAAGKLRRNRREDVAQAVA
ncbi:MAG: hypothetical protein MAG451_02986 [Anaerolineales bacterium]|nr:hypothetical protein [Anaerolineales bacterium]